jgi:uncharacterized protein (DUF433 family)
MNSATITAPPPAAREERELIPADSPLARYISVNPGRMHGEPCFVGSRVPIQHLFDHLRAGDSFEEVLDGFPPVTREQVVAVIDLAALGLLEGLRRL